MSDAPPPSPSPLKVPWLEVFGAALVALLHALLLSGRLHPDEVYQSLEPALNKAFGYGVMAWEWQVPPEAARAVQPWGIRNWAVPTLFSWIFQAAHALGVDSVWGRRIAVALPQWALHAALLGAVWRFSARRIGASLARGCLWLTAVYAPLVWFGGRTMSESFSVAFLVWGLERLDDEADTRWHQATLGGLLLGAAQITRYGSAAVILPAMVWLLVTRRWRTFGLATGGGLIAALVLGAIDLVTWGEWFHSFRAYVEYNVTSGKAAQSFGASPFWYYSLRLFLAPWAVLGLILWRWNKPARSWLFVAAALGYLAVISWTSHKEDRFLYPTLVLLSIAGTPAFVEWCGRRRKDTVAKVLGPLAVAGGLAYFVFPNPFAPERKEQFQLERKASADATGLVIMNEGLWGAGGFFYVGGNKPWCTCDFPHDGCFQLAARDGRFNRAVYWSNGPAEAQRDQTSIAAFQAVGFRVVETRGQATLLAR
ncbi:MAG: mannosyltransferase [Myxococcales bacterium]|nr:mannosyltransferase [Myxococcales bacterium]